MTSVVLSFSQHANQLATHFNNTQNDRFLKDPQNRLPLRHISIKTIDKKSISNIYPRSILYDYANGTGHLDPFVYFENHEPIEAAETISTGPKITKNEHNPCFWSDFAEVSYKPEYILTNPQYNYDPETFESIGKSGSGSFMTHQQGIDAFTHISAFNHASDEVIRKLLEDSDTVSNLNSLVNLETGWSGVCTETLRQVIDDHFNGHGTYVTVWSIQKSNKDLNIDKISKIVDFANLNVAATVQFNSDMIGTPYERTKKYAVPFDFVANSDNVDTVFNQLTNGLPKFVDYISVHEENLGIFKEGEGQILSSVKVKSSETGLDEEATLAITSSLKDDFKRIITCNIT
ncbi:hypothetical protein CANINC_003355 [Pichia inconspicua]|uniref:Protein DML1 n=1 Tax=Pichia inconspicua TaxID=52247 RepID=A0A4T0X0A2_9ASCO|nr:hypothetical protein CANINC_003355 [[Candida] inconspicua]